jgi:hypothetical protein
MIARLLALPALCAAFALAAWPPVGAQDAPALEAPRPGVDTDDFGDPRPDPMDERVRNAVNSGLNHLARIQNRDGSWSNDVGNKLGRAYQRNPDGLGKPHVGVTAIACMAFMSAGHTPDRGEHARTVAAGLAFILRNIDHETGWISAHGTRMYSHAFATMFLAEVYGQTRDPVVLRHLRNAVKFIVDSQNEAGAWRYVPHQQDSDMSVCVCQLQALRAAANVGVLVSRKAIEDAKDYVRRSYIQRGVPGGFRYQLDWDDRTTFTLTAAGVVALQSMGEYDTHTFYADLNGRAVRQTLDLNRSINYLIQNRPDRMEPRAGAERFLCNYGFWYGHCYAAQAMYQYQFVRPEIWRAWNNQNRRHFLALQKESGAWVDEIGGWDEQKNAFATAMACLVLSIPRGYLPIFQN